MAFAVNNNQQLTLTDSTLNLTSWYARFRNGVEAIPSLLRRRYHIDKIPAHGKNGTRLHFGFKIAALNFQKLLDWINSLDNCAPKIEMV